MDVKTLDLAIKRLNAWGATQPRFWFTGQPHPLNEEDARLYAEAQKAQANAAQVQ